MTHGRKNRTHDAKPTNALAGGRKPPLTDKLDNKKLEKFRMLLLDNRGQDILDAHPESQDNIRHIARLLDMNETGAVKTNAAKILWNAAGKGININDSIAALSNLLPANESAETKEHVLNALKLAAKNGQDITIAIPNIGSELMSTMSTIKTSAADALGFAAQNGVDITSVKPFLRRALADNQAAVRQKTCWGVGTAATKNQNMDEFMPLIVGLLADEWHIVRTQTYQTLLAIAQIGSIEKKGAVVQAMIGFLGSKWMAKETTENSKIYVEVISYCAYIMKTMANVENEIANEP